jgi:hypothetical protein
MTLHKITEFYTEWFSVYHNITSKFRTIAIMIQIKLIGMSMISYYTKVHLSKCNGSWVVSSKQTMNFNIQTAAVFVFFLFLTKTLLLKVVHPLKLYQYTKFHGPTLTGASFASTSEVWSSPFWNGWRYGITKYGVEVTFNGMISLLNFIKSTNWFKSYWGGGGSHRQTDWQTGDLINLTFFFKESRLKIQINYQDRLSKQFYSKLRIIYCIRNAWAWHTEHVTSFRHIMSFTKLFNYTTIVIFIISRCNFITNECFLYNMRNEDISTSKHLTLAHRFDGPWNQRWDLSAGEFPVSLFASESPFARHLG